MPPQLPPELWRSVASHLPAETLQDSISVNSVFFELGMDIKYRTLRLRRKKENTLDQLDYISRTPSVANRIYFVELKLSLLDSFTPPQPDASPKQPKWRRSTAALGSLFKKALTRTRSHQPDAQEIAIHTSRDPLRSLLPQVILAMTNLNHCRLYDSNPVMNLRLHALLRELWPVFPDKMTSFSLDNIAFFDFPTFPRSLPLKNLCISLSPNNGDVEAVDYAALAQAINLVSHSLESLELTFQRDHTRIMLQNHSDVLSKLLSLPVLKRLVLDVPFLSNVIPHFLTTSTSQIEELHLKTSSSKLFDRMLLSSIRLPRLSSFYLSYDYLTRPNIESLWSGMIHFGTLTTLVVRRSTLIHDTITPMCDAFRRSGIGASLRTVDLDMKVANGDDLDELALTFPQLRSLLLGVRYLWDFFVVHPLIKKPSSSQHLPSRASESWGIVDLSIHIPPVQSQATMPSYIAMRIIAQYIPSITSFCGSGNTEIPLEEEKRLWVLLNSERAGTA
ncbi:hypothetical protein ONZ45_g17638 [Pleurotus djamor]|nr:hypothetical protein ONZ45_g17638 [Pleurotus djamor]